MVSQYKVLLGMVTAMKETQVPYLLCKVAQKK